MQPSWPWPCIVSMPSLAARGKRRIQPGLFILSSVVFCRRGCDEGVNARRSELRFRGKPENICSLRDLPVLTPTETLGSPTCCDAQRAISYHAVVGCNPGVEAAHETARV